jgi:uncharacterized membrane protein (DUF4010 family)
VALAAVAGLGDVDAITLSMARLAGVTPGVAAIAILVAVIANSLSKTVLATVIGGRRFGAAYGVMTLVSLAAGGIAYLVSAAMA